MALAVAILSDKYIIPEHAFMRIGCRGMKIKLDKGDCRDMAVMKAQGLTNDEIGDIYGIDDRANVRKKIWLYLKTNGYKDVTEVV